ncbi:hypothetical protein PWT90_00918 [Aphanocladium album]|nr:hypothetical protein PWT90_00918 [Aphanocladium album]
MSTSIKRNLSAAPPLVSAALSLVLSTLSPYSDKSDFSTFFAEMKFIAATLLGLAAIAAASPTPKDNKNTEAPKMPDCAVPCLQEAVTKATSCIYGDVECVCANRDAIVAASTNCIIGQCGIATAIGQVKPAGEVMCKGRNKVILDPIN